MGSSRILIHLNCRLISSVLLLFWAMIASNFICVTRATDNNLQFAFLFSASEPKNSFNYRLRRGIFVTLLMFSLGSLLFIAKEATHLIVVYVQFSHDITFLSRNTVNNKNISLPPTVAFDKSEFFPALTFQWFFLHKKAKWEQHNNFKRKLWWVCE